MPTYPVTATKRAVNAAALASVLRDYVLITDSVLVEKVGAMPGQGVTSMFTFGYGAGVIEGVVATLGLSFRFIAPQSWRGIVGLRGDKSGARAMATRLFPLHSSAFARVKDDGVAEAALIALAGCGR